VPRKDSEVLCFWKEWSIYDTLGCRAAQFRAVRPGGDVMRCFMFILVFGCSGHPVVTTAPHPPTSQDKYCRLLEEAAVAEREGDGEYIATLQAMLVEFLVLFPEVSDGHCL